MLGTRIQILRQERKLTLSQLAAKTDISKSYLSQLERNIQTNPSVDVIMKIAVALNVEIQHLIQPEDFTPRSNTEGEHAIKDWNDLINHALRSGCVNEKTLLEIYDLLKNGKEET